MPRGRWAPAIKATLLSGVIGLCCAAPALSGAAQSDRSIEGRLEALEQQREALVSQVRELALRLGELRATQTAGRPPMAQPALPARPLSMSSRYAKGHERARVGIIEFSDFQCPYCAAFARDTLPGLDERYIVTGLVRVAFWNLPLTIIHPQALQAAEAAECAGQQGQFWRMHDALFTDQAHLDHQSLLGHATRLRLDMPAFGNCLAGEGAARVRQDLTAAMELRFATTPTFVIGIIQEDGTLSPRQMIVGARDLSAFVAAIDPLLTDQQNGRQP